MTAPPRRLPFLLAAFLCALHACPAAAGPQEGERTVEDPPRQPLDRAPWLERIARLRQPAVGDQGQSAPEDGQRLAWDLYSGLKGEPEAREALLRELFDVCAGRPADRAYVASTLWYSVAEPDDASLEEWERAFVEADDPRWFWILMNQALADMVSGRWARVLTGVERASALPPAKEPLNAAYRDAFVQGYRATVMTHLGRFQAAAEAAEGCARSARSFLTGEAELDPVLAQGFPWESHDDRESSVRAVWLESALVELGLALARTQLVRTIEIHRRLAGEQVYARLAPDVRAQLELRVAMAEVEGRRRGQIADVDPVARLERIVPDLQDARDHFRALWWWARALVDEGRIEEARRVLPELRAHLDGHPELQRSEILAAALVARVAREEGGRAPSEVLGELQHAYDRFLEEWSRTPLDETGTGYLNFEEWSMVASELITLHDLVAPGGAGAQAGLREILRAQAQGTLARRLDARVPDLERLRSELLAPGEGALLYWFGRERLHLLLVDGDGVQHVALAADFELDAARDAFLDAVQRAVAGGAPPTSVAEPAARFADLALPPEARAAVTRWDGVLVVGLDAIGFAPFELLPLEDGMLGARRAVRYLPSFPVAEALQQRDAGGSPAPRELFLFAAPECGIAPEAAAPFVFGATDREGLTGPYRETETLVGAGEATPAGLRDLDQADHRVSHWILHGERDPYRPRPGGLRLYGAEGPEVLWAEDIERLHVSPLVVMTACEAARAPLRRGDDGIGHLGSALFLAGASTVLLSHTEIGLHPSLAVLARFHRALRDGATPQEAMRRARAEARDPVEALHGALVHVLGLGRPRFQPEVDGGARRPYLRWPWVLVGLSALVLFGRRRKARRAARVSGRRQES